MKAENKKQSTIEDDENNVQSVNTSRRLFSKKSLVAPVVMTLANRSAWGATNVCIGSGFQSFAAAGGVLPSHSAVDMAAAGTSQWLQPITWYNNLSTWQSKGFAPVRSGSQLGGTGRIYEIYISGTWKKKTSIKKYTLAEVNTYLTSNTLKGLLGQLPGFSGNVTIYDALYSVLGQGSAADLPTYQIVTAMNNSFAPLPGPVIGKNGVFELSDYQLFYAKCVNPPL